MNKFTDITGQSFGKLTAIRPTGSNAKGLKIWLFQCECGGTREAVASEVKRGQISSCGCLATAQRRKAGMANSHPHSRSRMYRERKTWENMIARCHVPSNVSFPLYGARGISVCDRWRESFANFVADMGQRPEGMTIDRIDSSGNYTPGNCRWATPSDQSNNTRRNRSITIEGVTHSVSEWAKIKGINAKTINSRLDRGMSGEQAVMRPVM